jgi:putative transposase
VTFAFIEAEKASFPISFMCEQLGVSRAGFYEWRATQVNPCRRARENAELVGTIREIHTASRGTYGSPRVTAELRLGLGQAVNHKRVERLMRCERIQGVHRRRRNKGVTRRDPKAEPAEDLVNRQFSVTEPDRLWCGDITEHPTLEGKVYVCAVLDAWSRRAVGWSIADHLRAELVCDALDMARWRRRPPEHQTIMHTDHGSQYTSWVFGKRLRDAGLLASMGSVGDAYDNALIESFFGTLQLELLDRKRWSTRNELAQAIFEYIEGWYNPTRRHSALGYLAPIEFERIKARIAAWPRSSRSESRSAALRAEFTEEVGTTDPTTSIIAIDHTNPVRRNGGSSIQRDRPNPDGRLFGQATTRTRTPSYAARRHRLTEGGQICAARAAVQVNSRPTRSARAAIRLEISRFE